MSSTLDFQSMLEDYLPNNLLREELHRSDFLLRNIERDDAWRGGNLVVPFQSFAEDYLPVSNDSEAPNFYGRIPGYRPGETMSRRRTSQSAETIGQQNYADIQRQLGAANAAMSAATAATNARTRVRPAREGVRVHLKRQNGWSMVRVEPADFPGPRSYIMPERQERYYGLGAPSDAVPASINRVDFELVKTMSITDHRTNTTKTEFWYEER